jgi:hypothetical protein
MITAWAQKHSLSSWCPRLSKLYRRVTPDPEMIMEAGVTLTREFMEPTLIK